jgi:hypothetical protein
MVIDLASANPGTDRGGTTGASACAPPSSSWRTVIHTALREITEARMDWRDVLVAADLADDNWSARLDVLFGPPTNSA